MYDVMKIPDGKSGNWEVSTMTLTQEDVFLSNLKGRGRYLPPGTYKRLMRGGTIVMSNTPSEISDFSRFTYRAKGSVIVNGLGLGCVIARLLNKDEVTKVDVVEISEDVIGLVGGYFRADPRLTIHHDDAFKFKPVNGSRWDFAWHDIWDYICADNLDGMGKLHRKYGSRVTVFQDSWCKGLCRRYARQR